MKQAMNPDLIKTIQISLSNDNKIHAPILAKLSKYLKEQEEPYHEIQLIPPHLLPANVIKILNENDVSLYKLTKYGNHVKHLIPLESDKATYIFLVKKGKPNNILLSSCAFFAAY